MTDAKTPLDNASDAFDKAWDAMDEVYAFWLDLNRAMANPILDTQDLLMDISDDLQGHVIEAAYALVRAHQRLEQTTAHSSFPFDSLDEGYFCPTCGFVHEEVIENAQWGPY